MNRDATISMRSGNRPGRADQGASPASFGPALSLPFAPTLGNPAGRRAALMGMCDTILAGIDEQASQLAELRRLETAR